MTIPYTLTNDSITVILNGTPHTIREGTPQFHGLRDALYREDWSAVGTHVSPAGALQQWLGDKFVVDGKTISHGGAPLPASLTERIWAMASAGESPAPLFNFYERLSRNPSRRSVQQLFDFLAHCGIPIEPDGTFLTYKGVRADFKDAHSGTLDNEPGAVLRMPRNQISDDPNHACHAGLHVGALGYAGSFSERVVIVRVDPEHVVCVPYDHSAQKMRVCEYVVIGNWVGGEGEQMPSTTYAPDVDEGDDEDWGGEVEGEDDSDSDSSVELAEAEAEPEARARYTPAVVITSRKPTAPKAANYNRMNPARLMERGIDDLRKYASAHLKIVGASKLPGGKSALVSKIIKARKRKRR